MNLTWTKRARNASQPVILLVLAAATSAIATGPTEWRQETVDLAGGGKFSSLRFDRLGNAHVCYVSTAESILKYGFRDHALGKWFTVALDKSAGFCSLTLDSEQRPHISYIEYGSRLKYIFWDGAAWKKRSIPINAKDISYYTSIVLDAEQHPVISYYEYWGAGENYRLNLRHVVWNGKFWAVSTIDSTPGSGKFNYMAIDASGTMHIAYANVKDENAGLRYARSKDTSWEIEVLEGKEVPRYVYSVALALDKDANPHIAYTDVLRRQVKYAFRNEGKWTFQVLDSLAEAGYPDRNGIVLDEQGDPYISYYDAGAGMLKLAYRKSGKWIVEIVDQNFAGFTSSLQIDHGFIWLTYADETGDGLRCARRALAVSSETTNVKTNEPPAEPGSAQSRDGKPSGAGSLIQSKDIKAKETTVK
jgi:hypothetical protein